MLSKTVSHVPFYGRVLRKVWADWLLFGAFAVSAAVQGVGHAVLAWTAGALTRSLAADTPALPGTYEPLSGAPLTLAFVGLGAAAVKGVGAIGSTTAQSRLAHKIAQSFLVEEVQSWMAHGASTPSGTTAARASVALSDLEKSIAEGVLGGARAAIQLAPLAVVLVAMNPRLALLSVVVLVPFGMLVGAARRLWKGRHARAAASAEQLEQGLDELVQHLDLWRTYGAGGRVVAMMTELGRRVARTASLADGMREALSSANEVLAAVALLALVAWGARAAGAPGRPAELVPFAAVFFLSYRPVRDLAQARLALARGGLAADRLRSTVAEAPGRGTTWELPEAAGEGGAALSRCEPGNRERPQPRNHEQPPSAPLHDHRPRWERRQLVVERVEVPGRGVGSPTTFSVEPGEIVAIVAPTGAGKTTLLRCLLGLERDATGSISFGERDLSRAGVGPWCRPFAWVPQDAPIVGGTLDENLALGGGSREEARAALSRIGGDRLTRALEHVLIGGAGRPLSGGEQKLVAVARALASGLPILLLDEPTAGLDPEARTTVLSVLSSLRATHSVVIVTHERAPLAIADRVIALGSASRGRDIVAALEA